MFLLNNCPRLLEVSFKELGLGLGGLFFFDFYCDMGEEFQIIGGKISKD